MSSRARDGGAQAVTPAELFFDLVYVFAVTQLSGLIRHDLSPRGVLHAAFLLLVVWWAWIYTTWMVNWFDPASPGVLAVLAAAMFASLLMAAALPQAFGARGLLFAASYVALQVGRNAAVMRLLPREHPQGLEACDRRQHAHGMAPEQPGHITIGREVAWRLDLRHC